MQVVATANMDSVRVYQDAGLTSDGVNWGERGMDSVQLELANVEPYHLVRFERDGHLPTVVPVLPSPPQSPQMGGCRIDPRRDWGHRGRHSRRPDGIDCGWILHRLLQRHRLAFPAQNGLRKAAGRSELRPIPTRQEGQPLVDMHTVDLAIDSGRYEWTYYEDYKAYLEGRDHYLSGDEDEVKLVDSNLDMKPRQLLVDQGYLPGVPHPLFRRRPKRVVLCHRTRDGTPRRRHVRYDVQTAWAIHNPYAMATDTVRMTTSSTWGGFIRIGEGLRRDLLSDCITEGLVTILNGETALDWETEASRDVEAEWKAAWVRLHSPQFFGGTRRISQTLDAVVTITSEEGHGADASSMPMAGL